MLAHLGAQLMSGPPGGTAGLPGYGGGACERGGDLAVGLPADP